MTTLDMPAGFQALPLPIAQLSLAAVLRCGQSFRWRIFALEGGGEEYRFALRDRVICLRQSETTLFFRSYPDIDTLESRLARDAETLSWITDYFQLEEDLPKLYLQWAARDKVFAGLQSRFQGIRILRQDPWENLISFICSSNNNISRITKMVQNLCKHFSPSFISLPHPDGSGAAETYHPFPPPSVLAAPQVSATLRSLGFGYRAEYIQKTAKLLLDAHGAGITDRNSVEPSELWLRGLRKLGTQQAREELLKFVGVGRKVADCVLLMSLDKKEVIPVDTHVQQIAVKHYGMKSSGPGKGTMNPKLYQAINDKLMAVWGEYAGWAHTILFTADLKSFSSYGLADGSQLPTPPATPQKRKSDGSEKQIAKKRRVSGA